VPAYSWYGLCTPRARRQRFILHPRKFVASAKREHLRRRSGSWLHAAAQAALWTDNTATSAALVRFRCPRTRGAHGAYWIGLAGDGFSAGPGATRERSGGPARAVGQGPQGQVAIAVKHLGTGESYYLHADEPMPTASLIKLRS